MRVAAHEELTRLIERLFQETPSRLPGLELVALDLSREGKRAVVRVFIDREGVASRRRLAGGPASEEVEVEGISGRAGITLDDCARATRILGDYLDNDPELAPLTESLGAYVLEVSSPGMERPLRTRAHFEQFRGEVAAVTTHEKILGRAHHAGVIAEVKAEAIVLDQPDVGRTEIRYSEIKRAHLKCDPWQMVRAANRQKQPVSHRRGTRT